MDGLSRVYGPFAGPATAAAAEAFDPNDMFDGVLSARLLGGVTLAEVLGDAGPQQAPKVGRRTVDADTVEATVRWDPVLRSVAEPKELIRAGADSTLSIVTKALLRKSGEPSFSVDGELRDVVLNLWGTGDLHFITVPLTVVRFTAGSDRKSDVTVRIGTVTFHGPLEFVAALSKALAFGDGSGVTVSVEPDRIGILLGVRIPTINAAILTISGIVVAVGLQIPFDGGPVRMLFELSRRDDPFDILVYGLGGGGYVGLAIGADGVEAFEVTLEFGAGLAIDIGVASGSVEVKAGISYSMATLADGGQECGLVAYLRLYGELTVLGLISLSLEFYLSLEFHSPPARLIGEATLTVTIEVAFFSDDVTMTVRRELMRDGGGGGVQNASKLVKGARRRAGALAAAATGAGPVHFADIHPTPAAWSAGYCDLFAALGA